MKGKLCIPWFILAWFWFGRSGVSVRRARLRRGNGGIKLPCPLECWEDVSRKERRVPLCGRCRLDCIHAAGFCGLILLPSHMSLLLVPFKGK